ncbi:aminoglycoside phosphotransferase family protein [Nocardia brasiliensis]
MHEAGHDVSLLARGERLRKAVLLIAGMLACVSAVQAPAGLRRLGDIAARMVADLPKARAALVVTDERELFARCGGAIREVMDEPGDRLLHWDLHYENVLAATRAPWLAIDPKPSPGIPGSTCFPPSTAASSPMTLWPSMFRVVPACPHRAGRTPVGLINWGRSVDTRA